MDTLWQDLRYGVRMLLKYPGFTLVAIIALGLGIGANSSIFSVANAVLFNSLPYPQSDRLVRLNESTPQFERGSIAYPNFLDWRKRNRSFENISIFRLASFNIADTGLPERVTGRYVSANFLTTLKVKPLLGRDFSPSEDEPGASATVILSNGLWQRRYGGDPHVLGKTLAIDGRDFTIVGVLPANFTFY